MNNRPPAPPCPPPRSMKERLFGGLVETKESARAQRDYEMLTLVQKMANTSPVAAKSATGISLLKYPERTGAHSIALFLCPQFMAGVTGALSSAPLLWGGKANPVASATLLISLNGGGSSTNPETTVMETIPFFALCERTGKYQARRKLTEAQIIKAAQKLLQGRVCRGAKLTDPATVKNYLATYYAEHKAETFLCLFTDNQHRLLKVEPMFHGAIDGASVYPREVVRRCLELNAAAVIFAHNHPGGTTKPSTADRMITERLKEALRLVDVRALDHFIVGGADAYSFAENDLM